jgi:hypothetical protein
VRVALLSYRSDPCSGGQGVHVGNLSREQVRLGHEVEVFSGQPYPELDDGVVLTRVPSLDLYRQPDPFRTPGQDKQRSLRRWYGLLRMQGRVARALRHIVTVSRGSAADIVRTSACRMNSCE